MATITRTPIDERLFVSAIQSLELLSVHIGKELALYPHLLEARTVGELASRAGIDERYAREWLEQQAVAGFVEVDDSPAPWDVRRYSLRPEIAPAFIDPVSPLHVSPLAQMVLGAAQAMDQVVAAYRSGSGVRKHFRTGQADINRPAFARELVDSWINAMPDVKERLDNSGRIADVGCGLGYSTLALASGFPNAEVIGIDVDRASIDDARAIAARDGVDVRYEWADAAAVPSHGPFDLVTILEALHDMSAPVAVLTGIRDSLAPGGVVLVADEGVADSFVAPGDEIERFMYGWSVNHCLPAAMAEQPSAAIGTVIRPDLVEALAREAGFASVSRIDADGGFFHLYRLDV